MGKLKFIDPSTKEIYEVSDADVESAQLMGLQPVSDEDEKVEEAKQRILSKLPSWVPTGAAVFAAQAADEFLMGAAEAYLEFDSNDKFFIEAKNRIKEEHALANIAGGITGAVGSLAYGGPLFKLGSKAAGTVTSNVLLKSAGGLATEAAGSSLILRTGEVAGKIHHDLTSEESLYYNPDAGAFTLIADGLADVTKETAKDTLQGLLFAGGISALSMGASKAYRQIKGKSKSSPKTIPNLDYNSASAAETAYVTSAKDDKVYKMIDDLRVALADGNTQAAESLEKKIVEKAKSRVKNNVDEILEASKTFGVDPMPEALLKLNDPLVDHYVTTYGTTATEAGRIKQVQVDDAFKKIQNKIESDFNFGRFTNEGERVILTNARRDLADAIAKEADAFSREYEALNDLWKSTVDENDFRKLKNTLEQLTDDYAFNQSLSTKLESLSSFITTKAEQRGKVTLNDLQRIKQTVRGWYNEVSPTEINAIAAKIDNATEQIINSSAIKNGQEELLLRKKTIDESYAQFKQALEDIGDRLAPIGSQSNRDLILESLMRLDDVALIDRVTNTKGKALRDALAKFNLENVVQDLGELKLYRTFERLKVDGEVNLRRFTNAIKDLKKDYATWDQVYGQKGKILDHAVTFLDALPSNYTTTRFTSNLNKTLRELQTGTRLYEGSLDVLATIAEKGLVKGGSDLLMALPQAALNRLNAKKAQTTEELMRNIVDFARGVRKPSTVKDISPLYHLATGVKKKGSQIRELIGSGVGDGNPIERLTGYFLRQYERKEEAEERAKSRFEDYAAFKKNLLDNLDDAVINQLLNAEFTGKEAADEKVNSILRDLSDELPMTSAVIKTQGGALNQLLMFELIKKREETGPFNVANTTGKQLTDVEKQKVTDAIGAVLFPDVAMAKIVSNKATPFEIAAFTTSYPSLSRAIGEKLFQIEKEKADRESRKPSLATKITLSYLLGQPIDTQFDAIRLANNQRVINGIEGAPNQTRMPPIKRGAVKMPSNLSNVERVEFRN